MFLFACTVIHRACFYRYSLVHGIGSMPRTVDDLHSCSTTPSDISQGHLRSAGCINVHMTYTWPEFLVDLHSCSTSSSGSSQSLLRVGAWDNDHMAYTWLEFSDYYGEFASAAWSEAIPAMTLDGELLMVFVTLGDSTGWCHAHRLKEKSDFFRAWFERWRTRNRCCEITILRHAVDVVTAHQILAYFQYATPTSHFPGSGVADLADYLGMVGFLKTQLVT